MDWILGVAKIGLPYTDELCPINSKFSQWCKPFIDGRPGWKWFEGFMKRHPEVSQKQLIILTKLEGK